MMDAVKKGGNRQELHEKIRIHSIAAGKKVKECGEANDLIERILADDAFCLSEEEISRSLKPENYVGRAPEQTEEFIAEYIKPMLDKYSGNMERKAELSV